VKQSSSGVLLLFLGSDLSSGVGEFDSDLLGALDDLCSDSGADVMCDFSAEGAVVHEEDVEVLGVVDEELLESVGEEVLGGVVRAVSDLGHLLVASEATTHAVINACDRGGGYLWVFSSSRPVCRRRGLTGSG
jgi:hypothetical protein